MASNAKVALLGKLGHGKTFLLNKICGSHFPSHMGARSCTRTLQTGDTRLLGITVIDTPGFGASEDIAAHVAAQKYALEGVSLSGVYVVVKYARADEIAEMLQKVMNFVGDDDIRIIITHSDVASQQEGYCEAEMKKSVSELLDIPTQNIAVVGTDTSAALVEGFIKSTLHQSRANCTHFISQSWFEETHQSHRSSLEAASKECHDLTQLDKWYQTDVAVTVIQNAMTTEMREMKEQIFRDAADLTPQQQNLVYGKAGLALNMRLKDFIDATNKCLSWDVTNPTDPRNVYKSCNFCGAVYNKTEGCDGATVCGAVPRDHKRPRPRFIVQFQASESGWVIQYFFDGAEVIREYARSSLAQYHIMAFEWGGGVNNRQREDANFESGCGATINWSTMLPVDTALVDSLGVVEVERPGLSEELSRVTWEYRLREHEQRNETILRESIGENS